MWATVQSVQITLHYSTGVGHITGLGQGAGLHFPLSHHLVCAQ